MHALNFVVWLKFSPAICIKKIYSHHKVHHYSFVWSSNSWWIHFPVHKFIFCSLQPMIVSSCFNFESIIFKWKRNTRRRLEFNVTWKRNTTNYEKGRTHCQLSIIYMYNSYKIFKTFNYKKWTKIERTIIINTRRLLESKQNKKI